MNNLKEKTDYKRIDSDFKHEIAKICGGESMKYCYQCGACTSGCPLARLINVYRPNRILQAAKLGLRSIPQSSAFLLCSACTQCTKNCPQSVTVHGIMHALKEANLSDPAVREYLADRFEVDLAALSAEIPFPVSYAWICLPEEDGEDGFYKTLRETMRKSLAEKAAKKGKGKPKNAPKVAVIGSGPCGITAAWTLANAGCAVTVYESLPEAGGMLLAGIPDYRLPNEVVAAEIENVKKAGVEIKTGVAVDRKLFDKLTKDGGLVLIATGAQSNRNLRIEGADLQGVVPVLDFLKKFNLKQPTNIGKNVVVIGGGNVGIDAARTALRCGASSVKLFCLESRNEMPAFGWEIKAAEDEGVKLYPSWGPKVITGANGQVNGVEFIRCKSVFNAEKKFAPVFDEKTVEKTEADTVIMAIGQYPDLGFVSPAVEKERGAVVVNPETMETNIPGVYAGGDTVSGTASLLEAIVAGKTAATYIIKRVKG